jgi:hypothetical protein
VVSLKRWAPVVLAVGCEGPTVEPSAPPAEVRPAIATSAPAPEDTPAEPRPIGQFTITFYYVIGEEEVSPRPANDNTGDDKELAATAEPAEQVTLYEADGCSPIAEVST